jgi:transposase
VRVWCWPGNTTDSTLIRQVKHDLRDWTLARVIWVADRGFASAENRCLRRGDHHYIIGEKLRSGSAEATAALARQGRYAEVAGNLRVKEVRFSEHERFVICHNPDAAERDAAVRARMLAQLEETITGADKLTATKRAELRGVTPGGLLRVDKTATKAEANLDGKYLLRSSDPHLPAEDIALGYKQLLEVERGWRDMKQIIDLRPVYHRLEDRIRAHVILCWLGAAADPCHRDHHRHHLASPPPRPGPPPRRRLHRPDRQLPPAHRPHQNPTRHLRQAPADPAQADHRTRHPP